MCITSFVAGMVALWGVSRVLWDSTTVQVVRASPQVLPSSSYSGDRGLLAFVARLLVSEVVGVVWGKVVWGCCGVT